MSVCASVQNDCIKLEKSCLVVFVIKFNVFLFSSTRYIVIIKCHQWNIKVSVGICVTQAEFVIFETMILKKSVGSIWRQTECEFLERDLLQLWKNPYRWLQARGNKTGDQTYQLRMNVWHLDMIPCEAG